MSLLESSSDRVVAILLCTFNGERFLAEQLASFAWQQHRSWRLFVSDDGSKDATAEILASFAIAAEQPVRTFTGPQQEVVRNYLSLVENQEIQADYYAFADQDDIWDPDHLSRALAALTRIPASIPALYCGRTRIVGEDGQHLGWSPLFKKPPSFRNAIVQSIAGANTMVLNGAARKLLSNHVEPCPVLHDWWAYQLITAAGGIVCYDETPSIAYRQHGENLVGANISFGARIKRIQLLLSGRLRQWTERNLGCLMGLETLITSENREVLRHVQEMRRGSLLHRLKHFRKAQLYRQTALGHLALKMAVILKRI